MEFLTLEDLTLAVVRKMINKLADQDMSNHRGTGIPLWDRKRRKFSRNNTGGFIVGLNHIFRSHDLLNKDTGRFVFQNFRSNGADLLGTFGKVLRFNYLSSAWKMRGDLSTVRMFLLSLFGLLPGVGDLFHRLFRCLQRRKIKQRSLKRVRGYKTFAFGSEHHPLKLGKLVFKPFNLGLEGNQLLVFCLRYGDHFFACHEVKILMKSIDFIGITDDLPTNFCY